MKLKQELTLPEIDARCVCVCVCGGGDGGVARYHWYQFFFLPPDASELAAKAGAMKHVETKDGPAFDESGYKAAWDAAGGDCKKVAEALGLKSDPTDYADFINMCKAGKFKD